MFAVIGLIALLGLLSTPGCLQIFKAKTDVEISALNPPSYVTFESVIDPNYFFAWKIVKDNCKNSSSSYCTAVIKSPKSNALIQYVLVYVDLLIKTPTGAGIIQYAYLEGTVPKLFVVARGFHASIYYKEKVPTQAEAEYIKKQLQPFVNII